VLLQLMKVAGVSLHPAYRNGDFVVVSKIPILLRGVRPGDVVVFQHPRLGRLIKLVEHLEAGGHSLYVVGLDADSVDSRTFGAIPRETVLGKVIWHIPKK
jgi:signal peptidase I